MENLEAVGAATWLHKWRHVYLWNSASYWLLLSVSSLAMLTAFPASSILTRLYYQDGGQRRWIMSWVAVAGWPVIVLALVPIYLAKKISPTSLSWRLLLAYAGLGFLSAADNLMYSWAYSYLPASTASLLSSCSLTSTAIFAYFLVGKKVTVLTLNAIAVITAAAIILALDSSSDMPTGVTRAQYAVGFMLDIVGSVIHGLIYTLSELVFIKLIRRESVHVVLEQQSMVAFFGCAFTTIGAILSGDFGAIQSESQNFNGGPLAYCMVLLLAAIAFQLGLLGSVGILYLASAMLAGVINTLWLPITSIAAVIFLSDSMDGFKVLALLLAFWGFGSYVYGGFVELQAREPQRLLPD